ncbi:MAG: AAC(3) family N-acetyltransferase [Candidatus Kariarchaeaceae archaeon]|jgi:aminoglycoside 3-N-acetyltransferase
MFPHSSEYSKKKISKNRIIDNLHNIGLSRGDHVAVTVSYGKIGNVIGGPATVLESLLEVIGSKGTLMMNTHTENFHPAQTKRNYIFNPCTSVSITGYITELLRIRADSIRSTHPTSSITAIGKYSDFLTSHHDTNSPWLLPYFKLAKLGGKYLSIGLNDKMVAIRHTGHVLNRLDNLIPNYQVTQYRNKHREIEIFYESFPCSRNLHSIVPTLEKKGVIKRGRIGMANSIIGNAKKIITETSLILSKNPELNLCNDPACIWCREAERKLDLYDVFVKPKFYQYPFVREIIALVNKVRICKHGFLMYSDSWKSPIFMQSFYLYIYSKLHT